MSFSEEPVSPNLGLLIQPQPGGFLYLVSLFSPSHAHLLGSLLITVLGK